MTDEFVWEDRYIVFKLSDVVEHLTIAERLHLERLYEIQRVGRKEAGKSALECVVVESDWPEYESTWRAIEARVTGAQPAPSVPDGWLRAIDEAAESECLEQARLNGMGSEREAALMAKLEAAERERDDLRAKVEQMEKQEPVGKIVAFGESLHEPSWRAGRLPPLMTELYALPGAKGE